MKARLAWCRHISFALAVLADTGDAKATQVFWLFVKRAGQQGKGCHNQTREPSLVVLGKTDDGNVDFFLLKYHIGFFLFLLPCVEWNRRRGCVVSGCHCHRLPRLGQGRGAGSDPNVDWTSARVPIACASADLHKCKAPNTHHNSGMVRVRRAARPWQPWAWEGVAAPADTSVAVRMRLMGTCPASCIGMPPSSQTGYPAHQAAAGQGRFRSYDCQRPPEKGPASPVLGSHEIRLDSTSLWRLCLAWPGPG